MKKIKVSKEIREALLKAKLDYLDTKRKAYIFKNMLYKGKYYQEIVNLSLKIRLCRNLLGINEGSF